MGNKAPKQKLSRDQQNLHDYYDPRISEEKFQIVEKRAIRMRYHYFLRALIFGFIVEYFVGCGKIYENANRRSAIRRLGKWSWYDLDAKKK